MRECSYINAEEARKKAEKSEVLMNEVYSEIEAAALEGREMVSRSVDGFTTRVVDSLVRKLKQDGYAVAFCMAGDVLTVSW